MVTKMVSCCERDACFQLKTSTRVNLKVHPLIHLNVENLTMKYIEEKKMKGSQGVEWFMCMVFINNNDYY